MYVSLHTTRNHRSLAGRHRSHLYAPRGSVPGPVTLTSPHHHTWHSSWGTPQTVTWVTGQAECQRGISPAYRGTLDSGTFSKARTASPVALAKGRNHA
jgi:hypothetical protein